MDKISYNNFLDGLDDTYSVGVHGVEGFTNHIVLADNMLKNGLILHNAGGMIQNLQMFGQKGYMGSFLLDKLTNYTYITDFNKDIVNIIVAVPDVLFSITQFCVVVLNVPPVIANVPSFVIILILLSSLPAKDSA